MKKLAVILFLILGLITPAFADDKKVLPSETGIVENINYVDVSELNQGDQNVKQEVTIKVLTGKFKGAERIVDNMLTGNPAYDIQLNKGDKVVLHFEPVSDDVITADDVDIFIADIKRDKAMYLTFGIFALLVLIIGKRKGLNSLISIAATVGLIFYMLMPMVLNGLSPIFAATLVGILSTIITIYLVGGLNAKSTAAILGTTASLIVSALLAVLTIKITHLTGFAGEETMFLYTARPDLDFTGLLAASIIIAALGALMDTGVSIASTINEIHDTDSSLSIRELFHSGMNVGRDVIGTMSNTLILVYLGSALPLVLLANNIDLNKFFNLNQVATEITSALVGSIAILACVPLTAIISAYLMKKHKERPDFNFEKK